MVTTHKDLDVWKKAMTLATHIYSLTSHFPKEELYGLTSQIRRSAISIPSNNTQYIQESSLAIEHILCDLTERFLFGTTNL